MFFGAKGRESFKNINIPRSTIPEKVPDFPSRSVKLQPAVSGCFPPRNAVKHRRFLENSAEGQHLTVDFLTWLRPILEWTSLSLSLSVRALERRRRRRNKAIVLEFVISILLIRRRALLLARDQTQDWSVNNGIRNGA